MSEIKVGDQVAIGPFTVKRNFTAVAQSPQFAAAIREDSDAAMWMDGFHPDDAMPWHPALPALVRWLSDHPEANVPEFVVMLRSDAAALVEFYEALLPRGFDGDYVIRCEAAAQAITPEVLARAKEATR